MAADSKQNYSRIPLICTHRIGQMSDYSGLSDIAYTDPSSYRWFFVTGPIFGPHNYSEEHSICVSPAGAGPGALGYRSVFCGVPSGMLKTKRLWVRSFYSWGNWWSRRQGSGGTTTV